MPTSRRPAWWSPSVTTHGQPPTFLEFLLKVGPSRADKASGLDRRGLWWRLRQARSEAIGPRGRWRAAASGAGHGRSPSPDRTLEKDVASASSSAVRLPQRGPTTRANARQPKISSPRNPNATATKAAAVPWPATTRNTMPIATVASQTTMPVGTMSIGRRQARVTAQPTAAPTRNGQDVRATPPRLSPSTWDDRPMTTKTMMQAASRAAARARCIRPDRTGYRVPGTGYRVPDTGYRTPGTGYRVPGTTVTVPCSLGAQRGMVLGQHRDEDASGREPAGDGGDPIGHAGDDHASIGVHPFDSGLGHGAHRHPHELGHRPRGFGIADPRGCRKARLHRSGAENGHRHTAGPQLPPNGMAVRENEGLAGRVPGLSGKRLEGGGRRHVEDCPAPALDHPREEERTQVHHCLDIGPDHGDLTGGVRTGHRVHGGEPRVVDEHIDLQPPALDLRGDRRA